MLIHSRIRRADMASTTPGLLCSGESPQGSCRTSWHQRRPLLLLPGTGPFRILGNPAALGRCCTFRRHMVCTWRCPPSWRIARPCSASSWWTARPRSSCRRRTWSRNAAPFRCQTRRANTASKTRDVPQGYYFPLDTLRTPIHQHCSCAPCRIGRRAMRRWQSCWSILPGS